jgi:hypothetical protein
MFCTFYCCLASPKRRVICVQALPSQSGLLDEALTGFTRRVCSIAAAELKVRAAITNQTAGVVRKLFIRSNLLNLHFLASNKMSGEGGFTELLKRSTDTAAATLTKGRSANRREIEIEIVLRLRHLFYSDVLTR